MNQYLETEVNTRNGLYRFRLQVRAAWLYHVEGLTQQEIAEKLDLSRVKVNRLLKEARQRGIVKISVETRGIIFPDLEERLCEDFKLRDAVVVVESEEGESIYRLLSQATAAWLIPRLTGDSIVGLSYGRTLSYLPEAFHPPHHVSCTFIEVIGGISTLTTSLTQVNIVAKMAELCGGRAEFLNVPTIVSSPEVRQLLLQEDAVNQAFIKARSCTFLLTSLGSTSPDALLIQHGYLSQAEFIELRSQGAVGDVMGHFISADGSPVPSPLDQRLMGLELDEIPQIPFRILIACGQAKVAPTRAAIQKGLFNVLITDRLTASSLLED
jgi:DNA-binding transcriptional regulator LsrR (DeoR family)